MSAMSELDQAVFEAAHEKFVRGYIVCALWSSVDCDEQGNCLGNLDDKYDESDLTKECRESMESDCEDFMRANWEDLLLYVERYAPAGEFDTWECAGHDFWLTRNHHGAGFWDRGLKELGDRLTEAAHGYAGVDLWADGTNVGCN